MVSGHYEGFCFGLVVKILLAAVVSGHYERFCFGLVVKIRLAAVVNGHYGGAFWLDSSEEACLRGRLHSIALTPVSRSLHSPGVLRLSKPFALGSA